MSGLVLDLHCFWPVFTHVSPTREVFKLDGKLAQGMLPGPTIEMESTHAMIRFASEDVGNADPQALTVAVAAKDAAHFIGMPEGNTALAQAAIYLATAPKSNAVYTAYGAAAADAHTQAADPVPLHLRNAPTKLMKDLSYGKDYRYAHDEPDAVADMTCLPESLADRQYYRPVDRGFEKEIRKRLEDWKRRKSDRRTT